MTGDRKHDVEAIAVTITLRHIDGGTLTAQMLGQTGDGQLALDVALQAAVDVVVERLGIVPSGGEDA